MLLQAVGVLHKLKYMKEVLMLRGLLLERVPKAHETANLQWGWVTSLLGEWAAILETVELAAVSVGAASWRGVWLTAASPLVAQVHHEVSAWVRRFVKLLVTECCGVCPLPVLDMLLPFALAQG